LKKALIITVTIVIFVLIIWLFRKTLTAVFTPFILALLFFYLIAPLTGIMQRYGVNIKVAAILCIFLLILFALGLIFIVTPKIMGGIQSIIESLPGIIDKFNITLKSLLSGLSNFGLPPNLQADIYNQITKAGAGTLEVYAKTSLSFSNIISASFNVISTFLVSVIIVYYFLTHSEKIKNSFLILFPTHSRQNVCRLGQDIDLIMKGFLRGQLTAALIVGLLEYIGLTIVGVQNSLVLAIIGGFANMIPYFGPFLGAIPAVLLTVFDHPAKAVWVILVFIIVQQIDNAFISPKIIERRIGLHPLVSISAIIIGGELFGVVGMFFSVPVAAILLVIAKRITNIIINKKHEAMTKI